jgi:hypothetical protein
MRRKFHNADEAYNYFLDKIIVDGISFGDTKALFNVGFTLENPLENYLIKNVIGNLIMLKLNGNGIYPVILALISLVIYTVKYHRYGSVWLTVKDVLILITVGKCIVTIS